MYWGQRSERGTGRLISCVVSAFEKVRGEDAYFIHNFTLEDIQSIISNARNALKSFNILYINHISFCKIILLFLCIYGKIHDKQKSVQSNLCQHSLKFLNKF